MGTQTVQMTGNGTMVTTGQPPWNPRVFLLTKLQLPADPSGYCASYRMPIASYQAQHSKVAAFASEWVAAFSPEWWPPSRRNLWPDSTGRSLPPTVQPCRMRCEISGD